jgi:hypothetical protein
MPEASITGAAASSSRAASLDAKLDNMNDLLIYETGTVAHAADGMDMPMVDSGPLPFIPASTKICDGPDVTRQALRTFGESTRTGRQKALA